MKNVFPAALVMTVDDYKSAAVEVPDWARFGALYVPALDNGVVSLEVILAKDITAATDITPDVDTNFVAIYDESESAQVAASGAENAWFDITTFIRGLPKGCYIRAVCATQQTAADVTFYFSFAS